MLATCGGQNVCLIDCQTGKVMKRYNDNSKEEVYNSFVVILMSPPLDDGVIEFYPSIRNFKRLGIFYTELSLFTQ